jgi:MFS family permease
LAHEKAAASFKQGFTDMREGIEFLRKNIDTGRGIVATAVHRGGLTALTLTALLLERNTFNDPSRPEDGLQGFGIALTIAGIGVFLGAFLAPYGVARFGRHRWIKFAMFASAVSPVFLAIWQTEIALSVTAFLTAFCGQNIKVTNDALVQSKIDDYYRGRVFAVYDVVVNSAIVSGGLIAALLLPTSGVTAKVPLFVMGAYLLVAVVVLRPSKFKATY